MTGADGRRIDRTGSRKIFFSASGLLLIKNVMETYFTLQFVQGDETLHRLIGILPFCSSLG